MKAASLSRIHKELEMLANDPGPGVSCWPVGDNMTNLEAQIQGPEVIHCFHSFIHSTTPTSASTKNKQVHCLRILPMQLESSVCQFKFQIGIHLSHRE